MGTAAWPSLGLNACEHDEILNSVAAPVPRGNHAARPRNGATRSAAAGSSREAANAGHESNGHARIILAARFNPIPGSAEIAAVVARVTSSWYSTAMIDRWPWLTTRTSTKPLGPGA